MSQAELGTRHPTAGGQGDLVRRAVAILLMIYLAPALLVVFVVGGLGVALYSAAQLVRRLALRADRAPRMRVPLPHLAAAGQEASTRGR